MKTPKFPMTESWAKLCEIYRLEVDDQCSEPCITLHRPAYVNIDFDENFVIEEREHVFEIRNKKVSVTLWKGNYTMHVTVF